MKIGIFMRLIVGLGNPGKEYENTRHNVGFKTVDWLSKEFGGVFSAFGEPTAGWDLEKKFNSELSEVKINGKKALLVKPRTFVNKSGEAVKKIVASYQLPVINLVVIHDDLDIPFGKVKLSFARSSAGHKGVESIIKALKTDKFYRVRVGTSNQQLVKVRKIKNAKKRIEEINKFVTSVFLGSEKTKVAKLIKEAAQKAGLY